LYFSDQTWAGGVVFNFQSDPVRAFLIDNVRFLVTEYRADGFRFDEVSVIDRHSYGRGWDFCQDSPARCGTIIRRHYSMPNTGTSTLVVKERADAARLSLDDDRWTAPRDSSLAAGRQRLARARCPWPTRPRRSGSTTSAIAGAA
jgi:hypothetical protein